MLRYADPESQPISYIDHIVKFTEPQETRKRQVRVISAAAHNSTDQLHQVIINVI
jgi:hypothetical protein